MICNQEHWRAHDDQLFKYEGGSWDRRDILSYDQQDLMIATEGVFITLAEDTNLAWKWENVSEKLQDIIQD